MKTIEWFAALAFLGVGAEVADAQTAPGAHQVLMKRCQADAAASGRTGKQLHEMLSTCLLDGMKREQEKVRTCGAENKEKKGEEFRKAQSDCLARG